MRDLDRVQLLSFRMATPRTAPIPELHNRCRRGECNARPRSVTCRQGLDRANYISGHRYFESRLDHPYLRGRGLISPEETHIAPPVGHAFVMVAVDRHFPGLRPATHCFAIPPRLSMRPGRYQLGKDLP